MKVSKFKKALIAGVVASALSSGVHALSIDQFALGQEQSYTDTTTTGFTPGSSLPTTSTALPISVGADAVGGTSAAGLANVLGGNRDLFISLKANPNLLSNPATIEVAGGSLSLSNKSQVESRAQIQWDGKNDGVEGADGRGINYTGLGGVSIDGLGSFKLGIKFSDGGFRFDITLYTDATHWTQVSLQSNEHLAPIETTIPLSAFTSFFCGLPNAAWPQVTPVGTVNDVNCGSGGAVDLNNLGAMVVDIDPLAASTSVDLTLDYVNAVPEPGSVALLGAGLLGLFGVGRRYKKLA